MLVHVLKCLSPAYDQMIKYSTLQTHLVDKHPDMAILDETMRALKFGELNTRYCYLARYCQPQRQVPYPGTLTASSQVTMKSGGGSDTPLLQLPL